MYKTYQMKRTFADGRQDPSNGKWFARAIQLGTVDTNDMASIIQRNCSMKKSDVQAVLTELVEVMTDKLQESYAVKLDGFGIFKIGLVTKGALTQDDFTATKNVVGSRVNFLPSYTVDTATGKRTRALLDGVKAKERPRDKPLVPVAPGV